MKIYFSKKFDYYTSIIGELNIDVNAILQLQYNTMYRLALHVSITNL